MLYDINKKTQKTIPHRSDYDRWRRNLSDSDHEAIIVRLHEMMDDAIAQGSESGKSGVFNSSYLPGSDWTGTPFLPIWVACGYNEETAKLFYGLLVWEAVMAHHADWYYHRQESTSDKPIGLTYFQRQ